MWTVDFNLSYILFFILIVPVNLLNSIFDENREHDDTQGYEYSGFASSDRDFFNTLQNGDEYKID